jgi:hypothetical protein
MSLTNGKAPSSLAELKKLVDSVDDGENSQEFLWLQYTYEQLLARKTYHRKQQLKRKLMMKVASEHLSVDELASIDVQAEDLAEKQLQVEEETT